MRRLLVPFTVVALALAGSTVALADPDGVQPNGVSDPGVLALITNDDVFSTADLSVLLAPAAPMAVNSNGTQHYGPFASSSPDSSTCGNDWATDTFERHFTVKQNKDGTYTVVEQFKNGSFVTIDGPSPGACDFSDGSTTTFVAGGLEGTMHGYLIATVAGPQTSTDPSCVAGMPAAPCTTADFLASHFGGASTIGTFFFHYAGKDGSNQALVEHEWKNASEDRGGNHGDIATQ